MGGLKNFSIYNKMISWKHGWIHLYACCLILHNLLANRTKAQWNKKASWGDNLSNSELKAKSHQEQMNSNYRARISEFCFNKITWGKEGRGPEKAFYSQYQVCVHELFFTSPFCLSIGISMQSIHRCNGTHREDSSLSYCKPLKC